jgi:glycyl-tRNA synthetase alpha chain
MYVQGVDRVYDLNFNGRDGADKVTTATCSSRPSRNIRGTTSNTRTHRDAVRAVQDGRGACKKYLDAGWKDGKREAHLMALPAYDQCIKASHVFNLLDAPA